LLVLKTFGEAFLRLGQPILGFKQSSAHKSKKTKVFLEPQKKKIELFYLPPYSQELNPDELVRKHLKTHTAHVPYCFANVFCGLLGASNIEAKYCTESSPFDSDESS